MPAAVAATPRVISIDGQDLEPAIDSQLESALVVDRLAMPDMFVLVFRDPERDVLDRAKCQIGKPVKISTSGLRGTVPEVLIAGEITSIEAEYDSLGTRAVVRGYDRSHRLAAGRHTRTYQGMSVAEIAQQLATEAGLSADVDDTDSTLDHVLQANQSDLEFLYSLARQVGFDCVVDDDTLRFKRPTPSSSGPGSGDFFTEEPTKLVWNLNLLEFRARVTAVAQVKEVAVRGWDVAAKQAVIGSSPVATTNAELALTNADLADKVGGTSLVVVDHPVTTQEAADELAAARADQVGSAAFEATAVALGSPALKAGTAVSISGVDRALEGKWVISAARHEFGAGTYQTFLEFTGRQDRSLPGVLTGGSTPGGPGRIPGVVVAVVTDNDDPEALGRVRVQFPWLADDAESWWARIAAPGAGKDSGVVWMPEVGDEVLVAFLHGDVSHPVVIGGLWNGRDVIPFDYGSDLDQGKVTYRGFTSRTGHKLTFWESSSESSIQLLTKGGAVNVVLDEEKREVRIETTGKVVIEAQQDVEIKAGGSMKLEASGQMTLKGASIALN
jgi:uncharacterized protein involved in type VI secretion and phage assembly